MANSILKLKVESSEYDAKLKKAAEGIRHLAEVAHKGGGELTGLEKAELDYVKALGSMETKSRTAAGGVRELESTFKELTVVYNNLNDVEKQDEGGKTLRASLDQIKQRAQAARAELDAASKSLQGAENSMKGGGFGGMMGKISGMLGVSPVMLTGIGAATAAFAGLKAVIGDNISTAKGFEKSMSQLSSLTGMTGKDLDKLKEYAIDLGSTSTLTASQVADAFRLIGSQQPQLLSSGEALKEVTKYAITLSEAAGIDLQTAAQTLSTSINQMGGDSNNAARYVNVLAAASQKGAGDIAWLGEAITKSATAAKAVGTDYEELVANLEQLAKAGFDASTAGTALRSIIMNLEKQANNEFKPSVVGLTQAFENLGKANLDIVGYQEIAGKMFASQAMALANASQEAKKMTEAITGTNIAEAQAKTNTDNLDGALKSLASAWEGLNLHINSSNGLLKAFVDWCTNVIRDLDNMTTSAGRAKKALQELNGGDNGQPSKVDRQINALRGSNFKQQKYNSTLGQYDQDIKVAEYYKKKYKEAGWAGGSVLSDITRRFGVNMRGEEDIDNLINNLKTLREDYKRRAEKLLNPTTEAGNGKGKGGVVLDVDADTEKATKSIKELQGEIKKLKKLRDDAAESGDNEMRDKYNAQIKDAQAQIKAMRGGSIGTKKNKDDFVEIIGLIGNAQERVSDLQRRIKEAPDETTITTLRDQLKEAQAELDRLNGKDVDLDKLFPEQSISSTSKSWAESMRESLISDLGNSMMASDKSAIQNIIKEGFANGIDLTDAGNELMAQLFEGMDVPDDKIKELLEKVNEKIRENGGVELTVDTNTGDVSKKKSKGGPMDDTKKVVSGLNQVASGLQQMGIQLPEGVNQVLGVVNGLMTIIQGISTIIGVAQFAAITANTVSLDLLTAAIWANTAASAIPFANGGIVGFANGGLIGKAASGMLIGNHMSGDNLRLPVNGGGMIGVNDGELILNRSQQGVIANALEGGNALQNLQLNAVIKGEQIRLALNNNGRRTGRGEYVQTNRR